MKKHHLRAIALSGAAAALSVFVSAPALAAEKQSALSLEKCGKLAETAAFVVDMSGSMMEKTAIKRSSEDGTVREESVRKAELARELVLKLEAAAAKKAEFKTSVTSVAPYAELAPLAQRSRSDFEAAVEKLNVNLETFGRPTWVGKRAEARFSEKLREAEAIVLITDGAFAMGDKEHLAEPVEVLRRFGEINPGSCIHLVSAAADADEAAAFDQLAQSQTCAKPRTLAALLTDPRVFDDFVAETYWRDCEKAPVLEIQGINFAFDKFDLTAEARKTLDEALAVVRKRPADEKITIVGWTDWTGSDAYNARLSENRAKRVAAYFVEKGIDAKRLSWQGAGKSFKYSNKTAHGRWLNRRVDLVFGEGSEALISKDQP